MLFRIPVQKSRVLVQIRTTTHYFSAIYHVPHISTDIRRTVIWDDGFNASYIKDNKETGKDYEIWLERCHTWTEQQEEETGKEEQRRKRF